MGMNSTKSAKKRGEIYSWKCQLLMCLVQLQVDKGNLTKCINLKSSMYIFDIVWISEDPKQIQTQFMFVKSLKMKPQKLNSSKK